MRQAFWTLASWGLASCPISTSVNASTSEEPISTAITESTVQWLLHRRMTAQQQNALVSKGRSSDAKSPDLRPERIHPTDR